MRITWDLKKAEINYRKHKVRFSDVALAFDGFTLIWEDASEGYVEQRFLTLGEVGGQVLLIAHTLEGEDHIHIISARRAEPHERKRYLDEYYREFGRY